MTPLVGTTLPLCNPQYSLAGDPPGGLSLASLVPIMKAGAAKPGNLLKFWDSIPSWYNPPTMQPTVASTRGMI